jgi:hypothetical protein
MREMAVELSIGESILLGNKRLTVVDIHNGEIMFRIDPAEAASHELGELESAGTAWKGARPPR